MHFLWRTTPALWAIKSPQAIHPFHLRVMETPHLPTSLEIGNQTQIPVLSGRHSTQYWDVRSGGKASQIHPGLPSATVSPMPQPGDRSPGFTCQPWGVLGDDLRPKPAVHPLPRRADMDGTMAFTQGRPMVAGVELSRSSRGDDGNPGVWAAGELRGRMGLNTGQRQEGGGT
jgi:hypothetical protein